ncbi:MAG TPA: protease modulator HflK [Verrucomicrobiae bacterium]|jgi:membrane protease subunit HflK|nr:protease modulator HflK [Verrucomicrobiae bacterium]
MSNDEPILPPTPTSLPPGGPPPTEDAGSQALAEALRSSFFIVKIIMVVLVLLFLGSGFFKVEPQYKAIILRLGKPVGEGQQALLAPGLHWAFPRPIDSVEYIPFTSLQVADSSVGWYQSAEDRAKGAPPPPPPGNSLNPATSSYALTADTNIIHVVGTVRYRITDPIAFHFDYANAAVFITNDLNNALLFASSQMAVDDILTKNRAAFREQVKDRVTQLIDSQNLGVTIDQVDVDASPPLYLAPKFNELDQAMVKRDNIMNQAQSYANTTLATAEGQAATRVYAADAIRKRSVDMVAAQADTFQKLRDQYERNPRFFERIRQMSLMETLYTNVDNKITMPPNSRELRLQVSPEPQPPSTNNYIAAP